MQIGELRCKITELRLHLTELLCKITELCPHLTELPCKTIERCLRLTELPCKITELCLHLTELPRKTTEHFPQSTELSLLSLMLTGKMIHFYYFYNACNIDGITFIGDLSLTRLKILANAD
jgi:hypothetical protein